MSPKPNMTVDPRNPFANGPKVLWNGSLEKSSASEEYSIRLNVMAGDVFQAPTLPKQLKVNGRIRFEQLVKFLPKMMEDPLRKAAMFEMHPEPAEASNIAGYNSFCQYYKDQRRGAVLDYEQKHKILIYILPADEDYVSSETLEKYFNRPRPVGVMWGLAFYGNRKNHRRVKQPPARRPQKKGDPRRRNVPHGQRPRKDRRRNRGHAPPKNRRPRPQKHVDVVELESSDDEQDNTEIGNKDQLLGALDGIMAELE